MGEERVTYQTTLPGFKAFGLEVERVVAAFDVVDYTESDTDRLQPLRTMVEAAVQAACRRLAAEQPHLLEATVRLPELTCYLPLALPTWFTGTPPDVVTETITTELVRALEEAAGPALAGALTRGRADLPPDLAVECRPVYDEALTALKAGQFSRAARLYGDLQEREAWAEAATNVAADLPAAVGAMHRPPAPLTETKATPVIPLHRSLHRQGLAAAARQDHTDEDRAAAFRTTLQAEASALLAAPGAPELKAVLLGALAGPLPDTWLTIGGQPPPAAEGPPPEARRALERYLSGGTPAEAVSPKGGRSKWRRRNSDPSLQP